MDERNIYQKLSDIANDIGVVAKNLTVKITDSKSYKAVSEGDVLRAVKEKEKENGVYSYPISREIVQTDVLTTSTKYGDKQQLFMRVKTTYRFVNMDKPSEFVDMVSYGDGVDSQDKASGKAMTYADKYALLKAYKIETGDDPDQHASEELKSTKSTKEDKLQQALNYKSPSGNMLVNMSESDLQKNKKWAVDNGKKWLAEYCDLVIDWKKQQEDKEPWED